MNNVKTLSIRIPKEIWIFLKSQSTRKEKTMNALIVACLKKYKKKLEKVLT